MNPTSSRARYGAAAAVAFAGLALALSGCGSNAGAAADPSCTPKHQFSTINPGTLTVAAYDFAPHLKIDGNQISGVEGDLLNEIAKRECLTVTVESSGGAGAAIPAVQAGRADLAAADWWRTKARAKVVALSNPVYLDQGALVSVAGYKTIAELDGKKIGSVAGNLWNDEFAQVFGDKFSVYQDPEAVFGDLAAGRIDAVIDSVGATTARFESNPIKGAQIVPLQPDSRIPVTAHPGQLNWPTKLDNNNLTNALNENIEELRKDGTIASLLKKYGMDPSAAEVGEPGML
ncbi:ABC transporter substrate-binding protein [Arthrobacter sp. NQ7]|uniref:ABC transporter substrate-binding protein n=1 Tax=Arthrobacter sp. NQ7 TaxID=3032303 RepID=UPI00240EEB9E|nr:ABC transporter substrate-binding protein [Arthrobacter sp. NQ7]MDJ0460019.1 ABC transporter substrate-binding protein [Arthrobacter sp. NQ7]